MIKKQYLYITFLFILLIGCSTKKNTFLRRTYHNTTAEYNTFFNGNESLKQGNRKVNKSFKENYSKILPLFTYGDDKLAKTIYPEMDKAIIKASKVIKSHSITVKPKKKKNMTPKRKEFREKEEFCNWIDDSYLLLGKANFFKHDYFLAVEALEYVIKKYNNHPAKYEALIWLSRTFVEQEKYREAKQIFDLIDGEDEFPKDLDYEHLKTKADFYLKQEKYPNAIPLLEDIVLTTKKKKKQARYLYILAQIYEEKKDLSKASELYGRVIDLHPEYEMAFNAKINKAGLYESEEGGSRELKKQLYKMLKDDKNIDFQDQIYYALANIKYKDKLIDEALEDYKMSASTSTSNTYQKSITFLTLANIYFDRTEYEFAQAYYDSTISFLDKDYKNYDAILAKTENLTELVKYITNYEHEDSVQRIVKLPEEERIRIIDEIIEKVKEEELRKQEEMMARAEQMMLDKEAEMNQGEPSGDWYFYNNSTKALGKSEFMKRWGKRTLEDNWRRKDKTALFEDEEEFTTEEGDSVITKIDKTSREYYLRNLPLTDSLMDVSHNKIKEALYNLGGIYKDKLSEFDRSINQYEELNRRYTENDYQLPSYYSLYQLNNILKDEAKANQYKNLIIQKYPESTYAQLLNNPNFLKELEASQNLAKRYYEETYQVYLAQDYDKVIDNCMYADTTFEGDSVLSKFMFIRALSYGQKKDTLAFIETLNELLKTYTDFEEKQDVDDILAFYAESDEKGFSKEDADETIVTIIEEEKDLYLFNEKAIHFYVIVLENKNVDVNRLKFNISDFNIDYFSTSDFNTSSTLLNEDFQFVTVKKFADKKAGMDYYQALIINETVLTKLNESEYRHFVISADNYKSFFKDKNIGTYLRFFKKHYLPEAE